MDLLLLQYINDILLGVVDTKVAIVKAPQEYADDFGNFPEIPVSVDLTFKLRNQGTLNCVAGGAEFVVTTGVFFVVL